MGWKIFVQYTFWGKKYTNLTDGLTDCVLFQLLANPDLSLTSARFLITLDAGLITLKHTRMLTSYLLYIYCGDFILKISQTPSRYI